MILLPIDPPAYYHKNPKSTRLQDMHPTDDNFLTIIQIREKFKKLSKKVELLNHEAKLVGLVMKVYS